MSGTYHQCEALAALDEQVGVLNEAPVAVAVDEAVDAHNDAARAWRLREPEGSPLLYPRLLQQLLLALDLLQRFLCSLGTAGLASARQAKNQLRLALDLLLLLLPGSHSHRNCCGLLARVVAVAAGVGGRLRRT